MSNQWHNVVLNSPGMFEIWNRKIVIWIQKWKFKNQNSPRTRLHTTLLEPSLGCWQAACYTTKHSILEPKPYRHDRNCSSSSHCTLTYVANHLGCQRDHCTRSPSVNVPSEHEGGKVGLFTPYWQAKKIFASSRSASMCARLHLQAPKPLTSLLHIFEQLTFSYASWKCSSEQRLECSPSLMHDSNVLSSPVCYCFCSST